MKIYRAEDKHGKRFAVIYIAKNDDGAVIINRKGKFDFIRTPNKPNDDSQAEVKSLADCFNSEAGYCLVLEDIKNTPDSEELKTLLSEE